MMRKTNKPSVSTCGTTAVADTCPLRLVTAELPRFQIAGPERLVGLGFRFWMHGQRSGDIRSWEKAWSLYCGMFGPMRAKLAVGALSSWIGALGAAAQREIEVGAGHCSTFCRDECLAISMIAACQHRTCPAMRACAFALIESGHIDAHRIDEVAAPAQSFADTLSSLDQVLSPQSIVAPTEGFATVNQLPS